MLKVAVIALALGLAGPAFAQSVYGGYGIQQGYGNPGTYGNPGGYGTGSNPQSSEVQGYTNRNGTYVQPYERTAPNNTQMDNYNTRGNVNPNTGAIGTRTPRY